MKKIFTMLLVAAGLLFVNEASAQYRDNSYGNQHGYPVNQSNRQWDGKGIYQQRDYGYDNNRRINRDYNPQED